MPLISKQSLKSFLGENNFLTNIDEVAGLDSAIAMSDNMVYQKTLIAIPANPADAIPILQFCSHAICIYISSLRQNLKEEEITRRDRLYEKAMKILDDIQSGDMAVYDKNGNQVSSIAESNSYQVIDEDRSERL